MLIIGLLFIATSIFAQGTLSGKVTDADTGEPILFGDVVLYKNGSLITGTLTDFDGNYKFDSINVGSYNIIFKYVGYKDKKIEDVLILDNHEKTVNASLSSGIISSNCGPTWVYKVPLIQADDFEKGQTFTSQQLRRMPNKN